jgi:hypothetical protein
MSLEIAVHLAGLIRKLEGELSGSIDVGFVIVLVAIAAGRR